MKECYIESQVFNHIVAATKDTADRVDIREPLNYIRMEVYNDIHKIKAVACDGFTLAIEWADIAKTYNNDSENFVFYVKPDMPKMPKHAGDVYVTLDEAGNGQMVARVECANQRIEIAQPEKAYIQYEKAIANIKPAWRACFDVKYMIKLLKGIQAGFGGQKVVLEFSDDLRYGLLMRPYENLDSARVIIPMQLPNSDN